jgi:hypothetical protein
MTRLAISAALTLVAGTLAQAAEARILKVLPHLLDSKGRHALAPSLYERDAYQAELRKHPDTVHGLRFDVNWSSPASVKGPLTLRMELRTANRPEAPNIVIETSVKPGMFGRKWNFLALTGEQYREYGTVLAWRATLLDGGRELATKTSFLW